MVFLVKKRASLSEGSYTVGAGEDRLRQKRSTALLAGAMFAVALNPSTVFKGLTRLLRNQVELETAI